MDKKKAHHISAPTSPQYVRLGNSTSDSLLDDYPPPAYQPPHHQDDYSFYPNTKSGNHYYQPTPAPQTVIINRQPTRAKDPCCWGCLAALTLCLGAKECC
ncbi:hypothetical protein BDB01DRAFT_848058 [Pilobolus umbonatus]|nr:hypothetical protein BDB01DRAFT_848058 [Pilobolus umbonatus]